MKLTVKYCYIFSKTRKLFLRASLVIVLTTIVSVVKKKKKTIKKKGKNREIAHFPWQVNLTVEAQPQALM